MVYDDESDRIIVFGGETFEFESTKYDETWAYDTNANSWENRTSGVRPSPRRGAAMVYDAESNRVILFGGGRLFGGGGGVNDTWAYDYNSNIWTNMEPVAAPSASDFLAAAYDVDSDRMVLFGGQALNNLDETWAYDHNTNTWTNRAPLTKPPARDRHCMAYDEASDRVVLFGGISFQEERNDTWLYDYETNSWTNVSPMKSPLLRHGCALAYDQRWDRTVLFGSFGGDDSTWAFDLDNNTWTRTEPPSRPAARLGPGMAYDAESERVVLFGGGVGGDETWIHEFIAASMPAPVPWDFIAIGVTVGAGIVIIALFLLRRRST